MPARQENATKRELRTRKIPLDCPVCYGPHDEEIHRSTLSIRKWFKDYVLMSLNQPTMEDKKPSKPGQQRFTDRPVTKICVGQGIGESNT